MGSLPPYADVVPALETLARAGARLATLTNSPRAVVEAQRARAGIAGHFSVVVSCDEVRMLRSAPEPYRMSSGWVSAKTASWSIVMDVTHPTGNLRVTQESSIGSAGVADVDGIAIAALGAAEVGVSAITTPVRAGVADAEGLAEPSHAGNATRSETPTAT